MREIIIRPRQKWKLIDIGEIWNFRELLYIFVWKNLKIRYKQTFLGILWVVFQPLITMMIFTTFFGSLTKIPSGKMPYSLFVLCGLIFWTFFSTTLAHASETMVGNEIIIKKIYFPKIILPLSSVITGLLDFAINLLLLLIYGIFLGFVPSFLSLIIFPFGIILTFITSLGLGLLLASLNVKYRDVRYILPFFIQMLLFVTPVIYPLSIVSERNRILMAFNPMTAVIEFTRYAYSSDYMIRYEILIISTFSSLMILFIGIWHFKRTEQFFADIV